MIGHSGVDLRILRIGRQAIPVALVQSIYMLASTPGSRLVGYQAVAFRRPEDWSD